MGDCPVTLHCLLHGHSSLNSHWTQFGINAFTGKENVCICKFIILLLGQKKLGQKQTCMYLYVLALLKDENGVEIVNL